MRRAGAERNKLTDESDSQLLGRFAQGRDEQAFGCLMERHARMVLSTCARMLRNRQDAEDALQAVFLTLARRSGSMTKVQSLAGWLHGVSVRVSLRLRRTNRRRDRVMQVARAIVNKPKDEKYMAELADVLDEELARLPDRYREVVVLCDLEGSSQQDAARRLALPIGTVSGRLVRGRRMLRDRLVRRGVVLGASGLATALADVARASVAPTEELIQATRRGAVHFASGEASAVEVTERVATLVHEIMRNLMVAKLFSLAGVVALTVAVSLVSPSMFSLLGLTRGSAFAGTVFFDDFEDGSVTNDTPLMTDGTPVKWAIVPGNPSTTYEASNGDLRVSTLQLNSPGGLGVGDLDTGNILILGNTSIRAQVRLEDAAPDQGVGLWARGDEATGLAYWGVIVPDGALWIGRGTGGTGERAVETSLRPTEEDVLLQFDVTGDTIEFWAWRVGEAMPAEPLVTREGVGLAPGAVGVVYTNSPQLHPTNGTAIYRWVHVSTTHIPEPSSAALAVMSLLTLGLWRRPCLSRP